jgi:hypothetical protein
MPLSFPKTGNWTAFVGRTPLDPPVANKFSSIQTKQADEGVGCGPGGPPHFERKLYDIGKTKWHSAGVRAPHMRRDYVLACWRALRPAVR